MFTPSTPGDCSSTVSPANILSSSLSSDSISSETAAAVPPPAMPTAPVTHTEPVRHMLFGGPSAVQAAIKQIHMHGYAEPNDWSLPMSTGRPNEVMAILTKRVSVDF